MIHLSYRMGQAGMLASQTGGNTALLTRTCGGGCGGVWAAFLEHSKHLRDQTISAAYSSPFIDWHCDNQ